MTFEAIFQFWEAGEDGRERDREEKQTKKILFQILSDFALRALVLSLKVQTQKRSNSQELRHRFGGSGFLPSWKVDKIS